MNARLRTVVKLWPLFISGSLLLFTLAVFVDIGRNAKQNQEWTGKLESLQATLDAVLLEQKRIGNISLPRGDTEVPPPIKPPTGKE